MCVKPLRGIGVTVPSIIPLNFSAVEKASLMSQRSTPSVWAQPPSAKRRVACGPPLTAMPSEIGLMPSAARGRRRPALRACRARRGCRTDLYKRVFSGPSWQNAFLSYRFVCPTVFRYCSTPRYGLSSERRENAKNKTLPSRSGRAFSKQERQTAPMISKSASVSRIYGGCGKKG